MFGQKSCFFLAKSIEKSLKRKDVKLKVYKKTDSTNTQAKKHAQVCCDRSPVLFVAREQTAGRGRVGRSFVSKRDQGIYMTLLYFCDGDIGDIVKITTASAVAVALSVEEITGESMKIKWVNDIYNDRGKVAGILAETQSICGRYAIAVGIGINVGECDFPDEIKGIASSIRDIGKKRGELIAAICDRLLEFANDPHLEKHIEEYRARFMLWGKQVNVISSDKIINSGTVMGVDGNGGLILRRDNGEMITIRNGEVSIRMT